MFIITWISFQATSQVKVYASGGPEIIFSLAEIEDQAKSGSNILRFAPWFNVQVNGNVDLGKHFGFLFGGAIRNVGEIEFPFSYKEKTFINGVKQDTKITGWFTGRVPSYYNSVFVGVQFPYGFSIKFKYYLSEFFNQNFRAPGGGLPYMGLKSNVWYFSLNFGIFRNTSTYYKQKYHKEGKKEYY